MPDRLCVESKSLKFYLASYRNERAFNEAVTNRILDDFVKACAPREAIVTAQFSARGGIALTVRAEYPDEVNRNAIAETHRSPSEISMRRNRCVHSDFKFVLCQEGDVDCT